MSQRLFTSLLCAAALFAPAGAAADALTGAQRDEPLARFQDAVCPGVSGFETEFAEMIVYRIRENARALGLRLADEATCKPNVLVAALPDGQAFIRRFHKQRPYIFDDLDKDQRSALFDGPGPARSINRVVTRTRDGMLVWRRENLEQPPQTTMMAAHSRIYVATRRDIFSAMVVIDGDALAGLSVVQLADYATMRAFGGDSAAHLAAPGGSILTLFDGGADKPAGFTRFDLTFLDTLYSTLPNNPAAITLARAEKRIAEDAAKE